MKKQDLMIVGLAGVAVYLILKRGGVLGAQQQAARPVTVWYSDYNYANDANGLRFSATGADVRARR